MLFFSVHHGYVQENFITLHKKALSRKTVAASNTALKSTIYRIIENFKVKRERLNCCEEGFGAPKNVQKVPGLSLKDDSIIGLWHHQCRACFGMEAGR